jgi:D-glycerate 3-kinase
MLATDPILLSILAAWSQGQAPSASDWRTLIEWELADPRRSAAWGITPQTAADTIQTRGDGLARLRSEQIVFPLPDQSFEALLPTLWTLWLPLAQTLITAQQGLGRPLIQGILGVQGTGKTTLTRSLCSILATLGHSAIAISIDDFYKTYTERQALKHQDPRLRWRGPPGTHDIPLALQTLRQLKSPTPGKVIAIPRFDKSLHQGEGDRIQPQMIHPVDIVLFEGWFVGVLPVPAETFAHPPEPINTPSDQAFASDINQSLFDYLPLWQLIDRLMILYPQDYRLSQQWRQQAEHDLKAQGKTGMSDETLQEFVTYFWRALHPEIFVKPLLKAPSPAHLVIEITQSHQCYAVYAP